MGSEPSITKARAGVSFTPGDGRSATITLKMARFFPNSIFGGFGVDGYGHRHQSALRYAQLYLAGPDPEDPESTHPDADFSHLRSYDTNFLEVEVTTTQPDIFGVRSLGKDDRIDGGAAAGFELDMPSASALLELSPAPNSIRACF